MNYHMLNKESRKYFTRALPMSGVSLVYWALDEPNHFKRMQQFTNIDDRSELVDYLKTANAQNLAASMPTSNTEILLSFPWVPTIENSATRGAFLTQRPEDIYNSDEAPIMDAMFTFTSEVFNCHVSTSVINATFLFI